VDTRHFGEEGSGTGSVFGDACQSLSTCLRPVASTPSATTSSCSATVKPLRINCSN
jgi:hypothetical protein